MNGRRRHERFLVSARWAGTLQVREEVTIDHVGETELTLISSAPAEPGARFALEIADPAPAVLAVRVVGSEPVNNDGRLGHRLRLALERAPASGPEAQAVRQHGHEGNGGSGPDLSGEPV